MSVYYCGNNALHASLKGNGGDKIFGTHAQCFKKGYGIGYNAPVVDVAEWAAPYKPYIVQKLTYGNGNIEPGYQRATLSQSLARGFAIGRVARAKKLSQKLAKKTSPKRPSPTQKPTLPIQTTRR